MNNDRKLPILRPREVAKALERMGEDEATDLPAPTFFEALSTLNNAKSSAEKLAEGNSCDTMEKHQIAIDPTIHFGQPCIAGTRIPVYCILELVKADIPFDEIIARYYPDITAEDIKACVQYAIMENIQDVIEMCLGGLLEDYETNTKIKKI